MAQRIELTPEAQPVVQLMLTAGRHAVLCPIGASFEADADTQAERDAQAARAK